MISKISVIFCFTIMVCMVSSHALAESPDFSNPAIYADGKSWATKGLNPFPAPNGKNNQSFDFLFIFTNGADGQLPVAEAAPRNPKYNGGRWNAYSATWAIPNPPLVTSYLQLDGYVEDGFLIVQSLDNYFECPLLPTK